MHERNVAIRHLTHDPLGAALIVYARTPGADGSETDPVERMNELLSTGEYRLPKNAPDAATFMQITKGYGILWLYPA